MRRPALPVVWSGRSSGHHCRNIFAIVMLTALTNCSNEEPTEPGVITSVTVSPSTWSPQWVGARQQFTATAQDARGTVVTADFNWESLNSAIATIDSDGVATAVSVGTAAIAASTPVEDTTISDTAQIAVTNYSALPSGLLYTMWFARSDSAPVLLVDGKLQFPTGFWDEPEPTSPWTKPNVEKFQWLGDRIGLLTDVAGGSGNFWVRDRVGEWVNLEQGTAVDFRLSGDLIGVVNNVGRLRVKTGINGPWTTLVESGVKQWQISNGHLIAVMDEAGQFRVKDGVNGAWTVLAASGTQKFSVSTLIGVLNDDGEFRVKEGIHGAWTVLATQGAVDFSIAGDRIGVVLDDGRFRVKDGINGAWTDLVTSGGVRQFAMAGDRIAVVLLNGDFKVKDGIHGPWTVLATTGVEEIRLQRNLIGLLTRDNVLRVKEGIHGPWKDSPAYGGTVAQYSLLVDVPVPPARLTGAGYTSRVAECNDELGPTCYSPYQFGVPVIYYGRFCGADHPEDWTAAVTAGPIDPLDQLCLHHDKFTTWYPEADLTGSCVVRYGLHFSRLTRDGELLASGASDQETWDAAWGSAMPNLKQAIDWYFGYTAGCPLDDFIEASASEN